MPLKVGKNDAIADFEKGNLAPVSILNSFDEEYQKGYISELVRLYSETNLDKYLENIQSLLEKYKYNSVAKEILTKALDNY